MHQIGEEDPVFRLGFKTLLELHIENGDIAVDAACNMLRHEFYKWVEELKDSGEYDRRAEQLFTKIDPPPYDDEAK